MNQNHLNVSFSVIVAVYNNARYIERCIHSFKQQNYEYKELIIIDGGSTDGTVEILERNSNKINYWESAPDRGIYHAFNKGVCKSSGKWIIFLGSDDYFSSSNVLEQVSEKINLLEYKPALLYGKVAMISEKEEVLEIVNNSWECSKYDFFQFCNINHQGIFHHCSLFEENGLFDESFKLAGDYEFLVRKLKDNNNDICFLHDIVTVYRQISGLTTIPSNYIRTYKEFYKARKKNNINGFPWKLYYRFLIAYLRIKLIYVVGEKNTDKIVDLYRIVSGRAPIWTKL